MSLVWSRRARRAVQSIASVMEPWRLCSSNTVPLPIKRRVHDLLLLKKQARTRGPGAATVEDPRHATQQKPVLADKSNSLSWTGGRSTEAPPLGLHPRIRRPSSGVSSPSLAPWVRLGFPLCILHRPPIVSGRASLLLANLGPCFDPVALQHQPACLSWRTSRLHGQYSSLRGSISTPMTTPSGLDAGVASPAREPVKDSLILSQLDGSPRSRGVTTDRRTLRQQGHVP